MNNPIQTSPRLLPGVKIGDSWLSFEPDTQVFRLDTPDGDHEITGFRAGAACGVLSVFEAILSFMLAAAEAQNAVDAGRFSDNADIFSLDIMRWCQENATEIGCVQYELEDYKC